MKKSIYRYSYSAGFDDITADDPSAHPDRPMRGHYSASPYRLLWVKVIIRAVFDYVQGEPPATLNQRKWREEAKRWLFSPSSLENGFENVCRIFNLNARRIRYVAQRLTKDDIRRLEFIEREGNHGNARRH